MCFNIIMIRISEKKRQYHLASMLGRIVSRDICFIVNFKKATEDVVVLGKYKINTHAML